MRASKRQKNLLLIIMSWEVIVKRGKYKKVPKTNIIVFDVCYTVLIILLGGYRLRIITLMVMVIPWIQVTCDRFDCEEDRTVMDAVSDSKVWLWVPWMFQINLVEWWISRRQASQARQRIRTLRVSVANVGGSRVAKGMRASPGSHPPRIASRAFCNCLVREGTLPTLGAIRWIFKPL